MQYNYQGYNSPGLRCRIMDKSTDEYKTISALERELGRALELIEDKDKAIDDLNNRVISQKISLCALCKKIDELEIIFDSGWRVYNLQRGSFWHSRWTGYTQHAAFSLCVSFEEAQKISKPFGNDRMIELYGAEDLMVYLPNPANRIVVPYRIGCEPRDHYIRPH